MNKRIARGACALLVATMVLSALAPAIVSVAAEKAEKISSVSINLSNDGYDDFGYPIIYGETKSDKYIVQDITRKNLEKDEEALNNESYDEEKKAEVEKEEYILTLTVQDGYTFSGIKKEKINFHGAGATCTGVNTRNSSTELEVKFKLKNSSEFVGNIPDGTITQSATSLTWGQAQNAGSYTLTITSDVQSKITVKDVGGTQYDLAPIMTKAGTYQVTVYPVSNLGSKGELTETIVFNVTQELAEYNFNRYKITMVYENESDPSTGYATNLGWQQDERGWYWRNSDGTILQTQWLNDNNNWYYFNEHAAMVTNSWVHWKGNDYYFGADGVMLTNTTTPDGYKVDEAGAWIK